MRRIKKFFYVAYEYDIDRSKLHHYNPHIQILWHAEDELSTKHE